MAHYRLQNSTIVSRF